MKHCLVVGESRVIRKVACKLLEDLHIYTEEAQESASALEACRVQMPDAILIDLSHNGGVEFMRALRRSPSAKRPLVVFTTTENDVTQIREALGAGADEYMLKPFERQDVASRFSSLAMAA